MKRHFYTAPAVFMTILIILLGIISISPQSAAQASEQQAPKTAYVVDGQADVLFSGAPEDAVCHATPSDGTLSSILEAQGTMLQGSTLEAPLGSICCFRYLIGCDCCYCYYDTVCFYC